MPGRSQQHFMLGAGVQPEPPETFSCSECGYTSEKKKHFKRDGDGGLTCSTGHYDKGGGLKRARNPYAAGPAASPTTQ